jgi:hypothetical protein
MPDVMSPLLRPAREPDARAGSTPKPLRIANASAFWGDQLEAARLLMEADPDLDYVTLDYLAELSLSIMAGMREKNPAAAYARDFIEVIRTLTPLYARGMKTRIVTNAGGLDPFACGNAVREELLGANLGRLRVAVVSGDDVLPALAENAAQFSNLETELPLSTVVDRLVTANAYLGADAIAAALRAKADIVITGRVADPSLTVGPCLAHFDWNATDYDRIAGATVAGHVIECGTQACGGLSTDWLDLPRVHKIGFPIVEMAADGSCVVTKTSGSGGAVTVQTVKEQLLYEIGDPGQYLSPDATVSFLTLRVEQIGADRVLISGATGRAPPSTYKVSATYRDGFKAHGELTVFGHDAVKKARHAGEAQLRALAERGCEFRETLIECLGTGASVRGIASRLSDTQLVETVLRVSVAAAAKEPVERFTREIAPLVTWGPQGVAGYATGRPKVLPVFGYWPCVIERGKVEPRWTML